MDIDPQSGAHTGAGASSRSRLEFLYRDILHEAQQLVVRMEAVTAQQQQIQQSLQALPSAIQQAGMAAANQAAEQAGRSLLDATRTISKATSDLRISARAATSAIPAAAWRAGLICSASALFGGGLCAVVVAVLLRH